jgi:hypothetical protein
MNFEQRVYIDLQLYDYIKPGTHYPHVTWAHVMLRVQLGYLTLNSWRTRTLLSLCLHHVIWRGALVGLRASTPLKFLLAHTFRETWRAAVWLTMLSRAHTILTWREDSVSPALLCCVLQGYQAEIGAKLTRSNSAWDRARSQNNCEKLSHCFTALGQIF